MDVRYNRKRILIVDDEETLAVVLAAGLSRANQYDVDTATSGHAALAKFKAAPFDLVLTDYRMPGMDGIELSEKIRQLRPDVVIMVMTAFSSQQVRQKTQHLNLYEYIQKPLPVAQVRAIVEKALARTASDKGKPAAAETVRQTATALARHINTQLTAMQANLSFQMELLAQEKDLQHRSELLELSARSQQNITQIEVALTTALPKIISADTTEYRQAVEVLPVSMKKDKL